MNAMEMNIADFEDRIKFKEKVEGDKDRIAVLLKFSDNEKHLESLQKGELFLNTLKLFNNLPKGMGDSYEGKCIINVDFKKPKLKKGTKTILELSNTEDAEKHMLCACFITFGDLKNNKIVFTPEQKTEIRKSFGKHVLIIFYPSFVDNINNCFEAQNISPIAGKVKYDDYSVNNPQRIKEYIEDSPEKYLWKDKYFENQKEFRLVILNRTSQEALPLEINDMSNYTMLVTTEEMFSTELGFELLCYKPKIKIEASTDTNNIN